MTSVNRRYHTTRLTSLDMPQLTTSPISPPLQPPPWRDRRLPANQKPPRALTRGLLPAKLEHCPRRGASRLLCVGRRCARRIALASSTLGRATIATQGPVVGLGAGDGGAARHAEDFPLGVGAGAGGAALAGFAVGAGGAGAGAEGPEGHGRCVCGCGWCWWVGWLDGADRVWWFAR